MSEFVCFIFLRNKHLSLKSNKIRHIQTYSSIFKHIQAYSDIFKHIQAYSSIFRLKTNMSEIVWICLNFELICSPKKNEIKLSNLSINLFTVAPFIRFFSIPQSIEVRDSNRGWILYITKKNWYPLRMMVDFIVNNPPMVDWKVDYSTPVYLWVNLKNSTSKKILVRTTKPIKNSALYY